MPIKKLDPVQEQILYQQLKDYLPKKVPAGGGLIPPQVIKKHPLTYLRPATRRSAYVDPKRFTYYHVKPRQALPSDHHEQQHISKAPTIASLSPAPVTTGSSAGPGPTKVKSRTHAAHNRQLTENQIIDFHTPFVKDKNLELQNTNPCAEIPKARRLRIKRQHPFRKENEIRVHLKPEPKTFQNEYLEYKVQIPPRVVLRLEYLMGSNKVRLNDKSYMDALLEKLELMEADEIRQTQHERELDEQDRVKGLVIEGLMDPPPDLQYLYNHPVFRVNAMLRRLDHLDLLLNEVPKPNAEITPVEPFEYNAGKYFKYLHKTGRWDWVPKHVRLERREILIHKIERAKIRREIKLAVAALFRDEPVDAAAKNESNKDVLTLYSKKKDHHHKEGEDIDDEDLSSSSSFESIFDTAKSIGSRPEDSKSNKSNKELFDEARSRIIRKKVRKIKRGARIRETKILAEENNIIETKSRLLQDIKSRKGLNTKFIEDLIVKEGDEAQDPEEQLQGLKKCYGIESKYKLASTYDAELDKDKIVDVYLDGANDAEELFEIGNQIVKLYESEEAKADVFCKQLGRFLISRSHQ